jgi:hypothetical protein
LNIVWEEGKDAKALATILARLNVPVAKPDV